jgi:hypothetical protein
MDKLTEEHKRKIGESRKRGASFICEVCSKEFWRKPSAIAKGDNKFCSKACYFNWQKGRKRSDEFSEKCKTSRLQNLIGYIRISPANKLIRNSQEYKDWRMKVFRRDNWTCQKCGAKSKKNEYVLIEAHNIKPFAKFPELRFEIDNGLTLCKDCHNQEPKGNAIWLID